MGQLYLDRGEYQKARDAFEEDLREIPMNGWSLKGTILAMEGMKAEDEDIEKYKELFRDAWQFADGPITSACY